MTPASPSAAEARRAQLPSPDRHRTRGTARPSRRGRTRALVLVAVHLVILVHIAHWKVTGSSLSPLEPSEAMQTLELGYLNAGFLLFVLLILATLVLGRFFCGWACHVVAYQDAAAWLLARLGIRPRPVRSRLLVWIPFGAAFYMFIWPQIRRIWQGHPFPALESHLATSDFWATFPGPVVSVLTLVVCGFVVVYFLGAKGFCTYGCPYGAFFGVADRFAIGKIRVTPECEQCGICTSVCTSNVRVHEEVAKFGMVVDSGCMKTMDCVSSCPKSALHYGRARPSILSWGRIRRKKRRTYDFSWPEEVALAAIFLASLYAWRGLYEEVPFLFALGLSVLAAFSAIALWRLVRCRDLRVQNHPLRSGGRITRTGALLGGLFAGYVLLTGHSGLVQYHSREGERLLRQAEEVGETERGPILQASLGHLRTAETWGWLPVGGLHLRIGSILRAQGDLSGAEEEMRRAIDADPWMKTPRLELAGLLLRRGAYEEAEPVLEELLSIDPEHTQARSWLERLRLERQNTRVPGKDPS